MFLSPNNLSQKEIDEICERLWAEEKESNCPDCGVKPGEIHGQNCDISRCVNCGEQTIFEDCCENIQHDVWSGKWPGVKECYEKKEVQPAAFLSFIIDEVVVEHLTKEDTKFFALLKQS